MEKKDKLITGAIAGLAVTTVVCVRKLFKKNEQLKDKEADLIISQATTDLYKMSSGVYDTKNKKLTKENQKLTKEISKLKKKSEKMGS